MKGMKESDGAHLKPGFPASTNFTLHTRIESMDHLLKWMEKNPSVFARHRMYPSGFIMAMQLRTVSIWLKKGWFWTTTKNEK